MANTKKKTLATTVDERTKNAVEAVAAASGVKVSDWLRNAIATALAPNSAPSADGDYVGGKPDVATASKPKAGGIRFM